MILLFLDVDDVLNNHDDFKDYLTKQHPERYKELFCQKHQNYPIGWVTRKKLEFIKDIHQTFQTQNHLISAWGVNVSCNFVSKTEMEQFFEMPFVCKMDNVLGTADGRLNYALSVLNSMPSNTKALFIDDMHDFSDKMKEKASKFNILFVHPTRQQPISSFKETILNFCKE